ncbi:MAG: nucleoside monophosphate kinase [bacterium]|nr:nucleoside monophosphate kinase [bacterium]
MQDCYTFNFFGIQGSGKGTQIELLKDYLKNKDNRDIVYVYPGGEYRKQIESGSNLGNLINESMARGELQPDFLTTSLITNLITISPVTDKYLIFDGYPRSLVQSASFEELINFFKRGKTVIVYIELSKEEAMRRNKLRGRFDDSEESLNKRFGWYFDNVIPAMNYFKDKEGYELITINGDQSVEKVHADIISALNL